MIRISRHGKTIAFDDTDIDRDAPGSVRRCLLEGRFYEEAFLEYVRRLRLRGVYVDAGAYIGTHTLYFATLCEAVHVHAFEPRERQRRELERNVALNGLEETVTIHSQGLSSTRTKVSARIDRTRERFACVPLDEVVTGHVAVLKIDVEGMEVDVLNGATRILSESKPIVFAEAHDESSAVALEEALAPFGYYWTGHVFNASPTYEFAAFATRSEAQKRLQRDVSVLFRTNQQLQIENDLLRRRLIAARGTPTFRLGRATKLALRDWGGNPIKLVQRWLDTFSGRDEILDAALGPQSEDD